MSAADLAAVVVTGVCLAVVVVLVLAVISMVRTMRELRETVDDLRQSALPMVEDLRGTVARAGEELDRVDGVIGRAERISTTVDHASRLTYRAFAPPLIKGLALVSGVGRAARRFRHRRTHRRAIEVTGREHDALRERPEAAAGRPRGGARPRKRVREYRGLSPAARSPAGHLLERPPEGRGSPPAGHLPEQPPEGRGQAAGKP